MESVRDMVRAIRAEVRKPELQPDRAADLVAQLSALYGNTLDEVRCREIVFHGVVNGHLAQDNPLNKSEALAKTSPEYAAYREAKDTEKMCLQMISSLKAMLRMKAEEMRLG